MTSAVDVRAVSAALSNGDPGTAERLCRDVLREQPHDVDALLLLAISLHAQKRLDEAVTVYAQLTRLQPESGMHWANYATALREQASASDAPAAGLEASADAYRTALQRDPGNAGTRVNYGLLLLQQRDFPAAREAFLEAHALDPGNPRTRIHAARACSECGDAAAGELIRPWREWTSLDETLQLELARLLAAQGDADAAGDVLGALLRRHPRHPGARLQMAVLHERMNRLGQAAALLRDLAATPNLDAVTRNEIAHQQATLAWREDDPATARRLLETAGARDASDCAHYFTLAAACDRLDDRQATLEALALAHARQLEVVKQAVPHRFADDAPLLPAAEARIDAAQHASWPSLQAPGMRQSPVFIVGFPRSGTTLLEQMLDAHPGMQSMGERPFFNLLADQLVSRGMRVPRDLQRLDQRDCDDLRAHYWRLAGDKVILDAQRQLVDKNPLNMLALPLIQRLFPHAKIILAVRHPCDVVWSCYMQHFRSSVLAVAGASLERLARTYVAAMECWWHHVQVFQPDVLEVRYETLVAEAASETRRIADFLEVDDAAAMLDFAAHARNKSAIGTPSYAQVIRPLHRGAVNRWKRYGEQFEPVLPLLEPVLRQGGPAGSFDD